LISSAVLAMSLLQTQEAIAIGHFQFPLSILRSQNPFLDARQTPVVASKVGVHVNQTVASPKSKTSRLSFRLLFSPTFT
jgi:hypothetical protein